MENTFYSYISTKAGADCIQTIYLCAPEKDAASIERAEAFAKNCGWIEQTEANGAVLIVPVVKKGYKELSLDLLFDIYQNHKDDFRAPSGVSIPGRDGIVWLWETIIYGIGYEEGAEYLGNAAVKHSNFFAAVTLIDNAASRFESGDLEADHWMVPDPSDDYHALNKEVPVPVWLMNQSKNTESSLSYFKETNRTDTIESIVADGIVTQIFYNATEPAEQVRYSQDVNGKDPSLAKTVMDHFFNKIIRWKNGPDGTLKLYSGKTDYYSSDRFAHYSVTSNGLDYHYSVYLPSGLSKDDVKGFPLVFSIHGRGEPTWIFAEKNGWEELADETKAFVTVFPDSLYNIWKIERDYDAIEMILNDVASHYEIDQERVYLTGFSNGAIFTCQQASSHPWLFAAASSWNGPGMAFCEKNRIASYVYHPDFRDSGYDMPFWICVGDSDRKAAAYREDELEIILPLNHCKYDTEAVLDGNNYYTAEKGYREGNRFYTRVFSNDEGSVRVGLTVMKNMPHGAIYDESRAAWEFMRRFRRTGRQITEIGEENNEG